MNTFREGNAMNSRVTKHVRIEDGVTFQFISGASGCGSERREDNYGREESIHLNNVCGVERGELEESVYIRHAIGKICPELFITCNVRLCGEDMEIVIVDCGNTRE